MFWIRIGFNADPGYDLAFYLNAYPDPNPGSQTYADPHPVQDFGQTFKCQKV
jgi:hypothetical protein